MREVAILDPLYPLGWAYLRNLEARCRRYDVAIAGSNDAFDPELRARGVEMGDELRAHASLSLGTREQLSTILRLFIAEALRSFLVLDDQLVQSDYGRMSWLRELLESAAEEIQIIVFTCRPGDYLRVEDGEYLEPAGGRGSVVDLSRAIARTLEARESS
jgi:hypothetical protein